MREIIFIQIGNCGNKVGEKFWELITNEHQIDKCGQFCGECLIPFQRLDVYFETGPREIFVPRNILVDLEPGTLNTIQCGPYGKLFNPDNFISGIRGAGNNWAKGNSNEGKKVLELALNRIRKQAEGCDNIQAFQIAHSTGGGSGSGLGSKIMEVLRDEYRKNLINPISVYPSANISETVVEPYNAVLSSAEMIQNSDESICIDNEALLNICQKSLKLCKPSMDDLNSLIAMTMAGITSCIRFPGQLNADLRKLYNNLCPYPELHFLVPGLAPLNTCWHDCYRESTAGDLINQIFDENNQMLANNEQNGKYLTCAAIIRGLVSTKEIEEHMVYIQDKYANRFVELIPNHMNTAICDIPPPGVNMQTTFLTNTTSIKVLFERLINQFDSMLTKKAFLHWYTNEGLEAEMFEDAKGKLQCLIDEYQRYMDEADDEEGDDETGSMSSKKSKSSKMNVKSSKSQMKKTNSKSNMKSSSKTNVKSSSKTNLRSSRNK